MLLDTPTIRISGDGVIELLKGHQIAYRQQVSLKVIDGYLGTEDGYLVIPAVKVANTAKKVDVDSWGNVYVDAKIAATLKIRRATRNVDRPWLALRTDKKSAMPRATVGSDFIGAVFQKGLQRRVGASCFLATNRPLDVAISGPGFFRFVNLDGTYVYSRDGHFFLDGGGLVFGLNGFPLDAPITIPQWSDNLTISSSGEFTVRMIHEDGRLEHVEQRITVFRFSHPEKLEEFSPGLFRPTKESGAEIIVPKDQVELRTGFLEVIGLGTGGKK